MKFDMAHQCSECNGLNIKKTSWVNKSLFGSSAILQCQDCGKSSDDFSAVEVQRASKRDPWIIRPEKDKS